MWNDNQCNAADGTCSTTGGGGGSSDVAVSSCWTTTFDKKANVFGLMLYGTAGVKESTLMHAAKVVAQYLDNDEDGVVDDAAVVASLVAEKASMVIFTTDSEASTFFAKTFDSCRGPTPNVQDLYQSEIIGGGGTGMANGINWDASIEEIMHLIQSYGWGKVYPDLSPEGATRLTKAMDIARGGKFTKIPNPYPAKAWYTYDDKTCEYQCMAVEYFYWALTSYLGHLSSHCTDIAVEWDLCTKSLVMSKDAAMTAIITDSKYGLPKVLPDATYNGGTITVTKSTAQDIPVNTGGNGGGPSPTPPSPSPPSPPPTTPPSPPSPPSPPAPTPKPAASICGAGQEVELMSGGTCPSGSHALVTSKAGCNEAAEELGSLKDEKATQIKKNNRPKGCYYHKNRLWYNTAGKDVGSGARKSLCCTVGGDDDDDADADDEDDDDDDDAMSVCGQGKGAVKMKNGACPTGTHDLIDTKNDCQEAATELDYTDVTATQIAKGNRPRGCYVRKNRLWFNTRGKSSKSKARQSICCAAAVGKAALVSHSAAFPVARVGAASTGSADADADQDGAGASSGFASTVGAAVGCIVLIVGALAVIVAKRSVSLNSTKITTAEAADGAGNSESSLSRTDSYGVAVSTVDAVVIDTESVSTGAADATSEFAAANFALVSGDIRAISVRRGNPAFDLAPAQAAVDAASSL